MFKVTQIFTLPADSTVEHWAFPKTHCDKINEIWTKRIYGERFYSDDGRVFTTINIWEDRAAYEEFLNHSESKEVFEVFKQWRLDNNCTFEKIEEDI